MYLWWHFKLILFFIIFDILKTKQFIGDKKKSIADLIMKVTFYLSMISPQTFKSAPSTSRHPVTNTIWLNLSRNSGSVSLENLQKREDLHLRLF